MVDYAEWEMMTLVAGYIGIKEQASQVILISMYSVIYCTGYGFASPGCTMLGQNIGKCNIPKAKEYLKALIVVYIIFQLIQLSIYWIYRVEIVTWMTNLVEL